MNQFEFIDQTPSQKTNTINQRIFSRNIPSQSLQPYFSSRPVSTKHSTMPIVNPNKQSSVPVRHHSTYNIQQTFNPGSGKAPWSGYASNVHNESELRNQIYALQDHSQAVYVPSSNSDLYKLRWDEQPVAQPFPDLFQEQHLDQGPTMLSKIPGFSLFHISTRQEIKDGNF
jgi:hypothetical protein